ncbi:MAG: formylglycine-generating enzyme family protein, partial [Phycisphaerales bacterium]|nr:formylglycine-generating enzyme family protein [Phycisphaerales bacterium]
MQISANRTLAVALSLALAPLASAQPVPLPPAPAGVQVSNEYDFQFVTIGSPGNGPVPLSQRPRATWASTLGSVNYEYRLSRTELTYGQYFQFLQAFVPTYTGDQISPIGLEGGLGIRYTGGPINQPSSYVMRPGIDNAPIENVGWRAMAYYCNWLHNDKRTDAAAFRSGVYDAGTFRLDPVTNRWLDNATPAPGARFWISSLDEWTKGMHYDLNRYGTDQPGYWLHPFGSDSEAIGALPGTPGAQSSAGFNLPLSSFIPVGSYPDIMSPWGLMDGSGGTWELMQGVDNLEPLIIYPHREQPRSESSDVRRGRVR